MDYLVIGAGPAGLQLGWFLEQAGRDYLILEAGAAPDHTPPALETPGAPSAPGSPVGRAHYMRYLADFVAAHRLKVRHHARVTRVARDGGDDARFVVIDHNGRVYRAKRVVVATGLGQPYLPQIPGIGAAERYDEAAVDPIGFDGQRVLIIGTDDSAFETAGSLAGRAAVVHVAGPRAAPSERVTDLTGRSWAGNEIFLAPYRRGLHDAVLDASIRRIELGGRGEYVVTLSYAWRAGRIKTIRLRYDRVIACTGFQMDPSIFDPSCRPEPALGGRLPALTSEWESVNVPDLYFVGALIQLGGRTQPPGAFLHGLRYGVRALRRMLDRKYEGVEWPYRELPADAAALTAAVLTRINGSPGLFQRYAPLCDLIVVTPQATTARYYEEMPVAYVHDSLFGSADRYFMITLEYGNASDAPEVPDALAAEGGQSGEADDVPDDRYLHPVIRHYKRWSLVAVQRLPEDMDNDWASEAEYRMPLRAFLAQQMVLALA